MTKTILVADDSKTIQKVVALTFRASDFRVVSAGDADEALKRLNESRPDIVLADVAMPGKNGYELCSQIKNGAATAHIPVLLLAGAFEPFDDRRAAEARADGHIKKPFDSQSLIDRVKSLTGAHVAEMPMSFAASLAARQKPEEAAPANASNAHPAPTPSFAQGAFGPTTNPAMHAMNASRSAAQPSAGVSASAGAGGYGRAGAGAGAGAGAAGSHFAADLGVPSSGRAFGTGTNPAMEAQSGSSPFGPPRQDARDRPQGKIEARAVRPEEVMIEEPEIIEDAEVVDEEAQERADAAGPSLEPPTPPSDMRARANVDVWALADAPDQRAGARNAQPSIAGIYADARAAEQAAARAGSDNDIEAIEEVAIDEIPMETRARGVADSASRAIGAAAAEPIANAVGELVPGLPKDQLIAMARDIIERIAWEVVPDLAETIIRAEIDRLLKDRGA